MLGYGIEPDKDETEFDPSILAFHLPRPDFEGEAYHDDIEIVLERQADTEERELRRPEIIAEVEDMYTPFLEQFADATGAPGGVLRLMNMMDMAGYVIGYHFKGIFDRPRPHVADHRVNPIITVPSHSSYPSAHSVQTHLIAHALGEVFENSADIGEFFDVAERVSINREYAGVHYPSDTEAGKIIARGVFPLVRLIFDEVFVDAIAEFNRDPYANCNFRGVIGSAPSKGEVAKPGENHHHLRRVGIKDDSRRGENATVAMIDTAVDVTHPALGSVKRNGFLNYDYPVPTDDRWAMGSKGRAHGTAMGSLIIGEYAPDAKKPAVMRRLGVAPDARLYPVRAANLAKDDHEDRIALGQLVLRTAVLLTDKLDAGDTSFNLSALLLGLDLPRPDPEVNRYLDARKVGLIRGFYDRYRDKAMLDERPGWMFDKEILETDETGKKLVDTLDQNAPCDPLALAIIVAQTLCPVVIPSGMKAADGWLIRQVLTTTCRFCTRSMTI